MIELEVKQLIKKNIYFFAGNLVVGNAFKSFISGIYEKEVDSKKSAMELLKEVEDFVIKNARKSNPLQVISFQITNINILGEEVEEYDSSEQKKI
jgi:hypothetical protein